MNFNLQALWVATPELAVGVLNTLLLCILGIAISTLIGMVLSVGRISNKRITRKVIIAYVEIARNTPIVAQIFYLYFALPLMNVKVSAFNCGLIALVFHFSAYNAEVFRSGLESVPSELKEASRSLGFTYSQQLRLIILPLALRFSLPALINNYVSLLKHTAYVSVIGVSELTYVAQRQIGDHFIFLEMYSVLAIIYLTLVFGLTFFLKRVERKFSISF